MTEKTYPQLVWFYARLIAGNNPDDRVKFIKAEDKDLLPQILELLEENRFKCIRVTGQIGDSLRAFASLDHTFMDPTGKSWSVDMTCVAACADTPAGWLEALTRMSRPYPSTINLIIDAQYADREFLELFRHTEMDARVVVV